MLLYFFKQKSENFDQKTKVHNQLHKTKYCICGIIHKNIMHHFRKKKKTIDVTYETLYSVLHFPILLKDKGLS